MLRKLGILGALVISLAATAAAVIAVSSQKTVATTEGTAHPLIWGGAYGGGISMGYGPSPERLTGADGTVNGIAVDGRQVWWIDNSDDGDIFEAELNRGQARMSLGPTQTMVHVDTSPEAPTIDAVALGPRYVYWVADGVIGRASRDGRNVTPDFITNGTANAQAVAVNSMFIYWAGDGSIGRATLNGSSVDPAYLTGLDQNNPTSLAVVGPQLYWTTRHSIAHADGFDSSVPLETEVVTEANAQSEFSGIAADRNYLYWAAPNGGPIGRSNRDGSGPDSIVIPQTAADGVTSVAIVSGLRVTSTAARP